MVMKIDENEFFKEASKRICSSLSLGKALQRTLLYLRTVMPSDSIALSIYEPEMHLIKGIALATVDGIREGESEPPIPLSKKEIEKFEKNFNSFADPEVRIYEHQDLSSLAKKSSFPGESNLTDVNIIRILLSVEGKRLADLSLMSFRGDPYDERHAYLLKSLHDLFAIAVSSALEHQKVLRLKDMLADDKHFLQEELKQTVGSEIVGKDDGLKDVMDMIKRVAPTESPVLLLGETGVGKEILANAIHAMSQRRDGPLIKVNCGAIPETLLDSELFGHEKGAFTGAITQKRGRFERATGGIIFLDEIGELPLSAQVRLLRVLQNKEIERVGGTRSIPIDIRVIAATNRDLETMVMTKEFRQDLFFRLNVFPIVIPPLRERQEDIPTLAYYFLENKSRKMRLPETPLLAPEALRFLRSYNWPGNVRELENVIERALIQRMGTKDAEPLRFDNIFPPSNNKRSLHAEPNEDGLYTLDEMTERHIRKSLKKTMGKISGPGGAAKLLGVNASTLRSKMKKLGIPFKYGNRSD
ncbi:MAG: sigma-54 interaction domain-containing protein [Desulfatiglandales bacterium]